MKLPWPVSMRASTTDFPPLSAKTWAKKLASWRLQPKCAVLRAQPHSHVEPQIRRHIIPPTQKAGGYCLRKTLRSGDVRFGSTADMMQLQTSLDQVVGDAHDVR